MSESITNEGDKIVSVYLADETTDSIATVLKNGALNRVDLADVPVIGMKNHIYFIPDEIGQEFIENDD